LGDFDGDNDCDVFFGSNTGLDGNKVYLNDGQGSFSESGQVLGPSFTTDSVVGDIDGDGGSAYGSSDMRRSAVHPDV